MTNCPKCGAPLVVQLQPVACIGDASLDASGRFTYAGVDVRLSPVQEALIRGLLEAGGAWVAHEDLRQRMNSSSDDPQLLKVHVSQLRTRLRRVGADRHVENRWGGGYRWAP